MIRGIELEDRILIVDDEKMFYSVVGFEARIIAVPDAFDAMTSLRPHRRAMPVDEVIEEMERGKGKQFDPQILQIFIREKIYDSSDVF
jgi:HD-GYP domain-containing protein (c-di-GMP phosphodiesterase class II)